MLHDLMQIGNIRRDGPEELIGDGDAVLGHVGKLVKLVFDHQDLLFELAGQFDIVEYLRVLGCEDARHSRVSRDRVDGFSRHHGDQERLRLRS